MSTNLYWRPVPKERKDSSLGYELKFHIAEQLWGHDGSLIGDWVIVDSSMIPYLQGLVSAGSVDVKKEAQSLIKLIEKYGEVQLSLA